MAKSSTIAIPQTTKQIAQVIVNATGQSATNPGTSPTNTVLVATAGPNDSIIKSLVVCNDDTATRIIQFWISTDSGTTKYLIGSVSAVSSAGILGSTASVDVLGSSLMSGMEVDETGKAILRMPSGSTLYAGVSSTSVSSTKTVYITGTQLDY